MFKEILKRYVSQKNRRIIRNIQSEINNIPNNVLRKAAGCFPSKKVSFVIVGAQKGGTTALYSFLDQHPDISMSVVKETNFFSYNYDDNWKQYNKYFKLFSRGRILGEASPSYMLKHDIVVPRMRAYNPRFKIIFILRNPIDRAYSQYKMHKSKYNLSLSFEKCLEIAKKKEGKNIIIDQEGKLSTNTIEQYLEFGRYSNQIKSFQNSFSSKQMLFLKTEDLLKDHSKSLNLIFNFLEIPHVSIPKRIVHSHKDVEMSEVAKTILRKEYYEEITQLESILGWDLNHWK